LACLWPAADWTDSTLPWVVSRGFFHTGFSGLVRLIQNLFNRIETNENRRRVGELVTLLDEPYLAFLLNYLPSPPSSPAVGAMPVVVAVAYIAAVVQLSLA
jgi:hypothetical protein